MDGFVKALLRLEAFEMINKRMKFGQQSMAVSGIADSGKTHLIHAICEQGSKLIVTYNEVRAKEICEDMRFFEKEQVMLYPSKDIIFYSADVHSNDITMERMLVIQQLIQNEPITVVLSIEALMDPIIQKEQFKNAVLRFDIGEPLLINDFTKRLIYMGYERTAQVEGRGQFAIRGGIIDIFPIQEKDIYRIELFGDEVDSIRKVNAESQRSTENLDSITILPAREIVVDRSSIDKALKSIRKERDVLLGKFSDLGQKEEYKRLDQVVKDLLTKIEEYGTFHGIESYMNYYFDNLCSILDYMDNPRIFLDEPARMEERFESIKFEFEESVKSRLEKGYMLPKQLQIIPDLSKVQNQFNRNQCVILSTFMQKTKIIKWQDPIDLNMKSMNPYHNNFETLKKDIAYYLIKGYKVVLLSPSHTRAERMANLLVENGINAKFSNDFDAEFSAKQVTVIPGSLHKGFEYPLIQFVVLTESDLANNRSKSARKKKFKNGRKIDSFMDLKVGDYIVHENYGVGIFRCVEQVEIDGISKDFIKIGYEDNGNLFVATNQLNAIQKYIGAEGKKPRLNKLGTQDWKKAKARVKMAVEELAKDLVELYAKREVGKGYIYAKDTLWQREFEEMFPYEETDDQLNAIEDTKADMESNKIMDRLICGDVGYGKTEVAIRAAFKAVQDDKQVAYLVPTTILAQQHNNSFLQRMKDFPVRVEMLSRFKSPKEQKKIIEDLGKGLVDIIIGTHRIISKDVAFKNLGLLIIDEEQRFGVAHKEKIKKVKENIDVLTLTATPIPRTLHMSLVGIRDMSLLEEPPQERHPIQTYVLEYNEQLIKDAIYREIGRGGQVYYVYNRVKTIDQIASKLALIIPEARVAYAHGQMNERELESMMIDFINGDIDVLVSTTIIETGLDIPNVNTIIVQDADKMGLSQLYQLRGRVGRSNRVAYAYLMYKKDKILDEIAEKRLQAIREFTEFGSGFKIAMRDLEIRGAGNILGESQHGHMDAVGYDLYCKLLEQAVHRLSNGDVREYLDTSIDLDVDAFIPNTYIKDEVRKIEAYKKIASIEKQEDFEDVWDELTDRYGDVPRSVSNLLEIALIKAMANQLDIMSIEQNGELYSFEISKDAKLNPDKIPQLMLKYNKKLKLTANDKIQFILTVNKNEKKEVFSHIKLLLHNINHLKD